MPDASAPSPRLVSSGGDTVESPLAGIVVDVSAFVATIAVAAIGLRDPRAR